MISEDLTDGFFAAVSASGQTLGCAPIDLLAVMMSESGVRASAHDGDASGLIGFLPQTLVNLGWTEGPAAFRALAAHHQMPYVDACLGPYRGRGLRPSARLYQAVFLPATLDCGSDPDTVICGAAGPFAFAYGPNRAFDAAHKGTITAGDLQSALDWACHGPRWEEIVLRLNCAVTQLRKSTVHLRTNSSTCISGAGDSY